MARIIIIIVAVLGLGYFGYTRFFAANAPETAITAPATPAAEAIGDAATATGDAAKDAATAVGEAAGTATEAVKDAAGDAAKSLNDGAEALRTKIDGMVDDAQQGAADVKKDAAEAINGMTEGSSAPPVEEEDVTPAPTTVEPTTPATPAPTN